MDTAWDQFSNAVDLTRMPKGHEKESSQGSKANLRNALKVLVAE